MKNAILSAAFLLLTICGFSQYDYKFNYQAVVRNGAGTLVANGSTVGFRISILEGSTSGTTLYQETQSAVVNNPYGIVNLVIGDGAATVGSILFSGNFGDLSQEKFLKIEVDPTGGTTYTDMGATKLQFVPYAAHAFSSSIAEFAENGTQWNDGASNSINYTGGNVNIGTASPLANSRLYVAHGVANEIGVYVNLTNTSTTTGGAIFARNQTTGLTGYAINGENDGGGYGIVGTTFGTVSGIGVHGRSFGIAGFGVYGQGATGVSARTTATNGIAIDLDGFIRVNGTKTAFKTNPLVSATSNITLSYGGAASTDMVFVTPVNSSTTMPSWSLIWTSPNWVLWNASDDAIPSNFPAGTSFNVLIIKQ